MIQKTLLLSVIVLLAIHAAGQQNNQTEFWNSLKSVCGQSFEGEVLRAPESDTNFRNKRLVMHVRSCEEGVIKIPFIVGDDYSRTWVFRMLSDGIQLKQDHRHKDGSPDRITMYGGTTSNSGRATVQYFPADEETAKLLPAASGNVWWVDMVPGKHFTYHLRRMGSETWFSIRFDLSKTIETPAAPWGWEEY